MVHISLSTFVLLCTYSISIFREITRYLLCFYLDSIDKTKYQAESFDPCSLQSVKKGDLIFLFEPGGKFRLPPSHELQPATAPTNQCARTLRFGEPPFTPTIAHPCTLRSTSDRTGIYQPFFFELRGNFDGVGRRNQNDLFGIFCYCLVRLIDWECLGSLLAILVLHPTVILRLKNQRL